MRIIVLNGSPKGVNSVTRQYVSYIQKKYPQHEMKILNIAQDIKKIEKEQDFFQTIIQEVSDADGVLWAFPLYFYLVHSSYKRFIELVFERKAESAFEGKYTAAISTSIHFYDHTAHAYLHAVCDDLNMKYMNYFSAEMNDIFSEDKRKQLRSFAEDYFNAITAKKPTTKTYRKAAQQLLRYIPGVVRQKADNKSKKVVIVTDSLEVGTNLGMMIQHLHQSFTQPVEIVNLSEIKILGGCLGCLHCGFDNICVYDLKDDVRATYEQKLKPADILIFAGAIKDRYLSSTWKLFTDRRFFNTHQSMFAGKQMGYIISGPLRDNHNLRETLKAYLEVDGANLVDMVTDEYETSSEVDALIENFANRIVRCAEVQYQAPTTFLGIAGMKIFRDEVWGKLRFVFQGDHKSYLKRGVYDFPQKQIKNRVTNMVMIPLSKIPAVKKGIQSQMPEAMLNSYKKLLENENI